jgi:GWxTD domain-containing protein
MKKMLFVIFICSLYIAKSQNMDKSAYYSYGTLLYAESHVLPYNNTDSIKIAVMFKLLYDAMQFTQVNPLENAGKFMAVPEVEIYFKDDQGVIKKRTMWSDTVWVNEFEQTNAKDKYTNGYLIVNLPSGNYTIVVQMIDKYKQAAEIEEIKVKADKKFLQNSFICEPIFGNYPFKDNTNKFQPYVLSNNIDFTTKNSSLLAVVSYQPKYNNYNYSIKKIKGKQTSFWQDTIFVSGRAELMENKYLSVPENQDNTLWTINSNYDYGDKADAKFKVGLLSINIPGNLITPGTYNLIIHNEGGKDTLSAEFEVVWTDMPFSLQTIEYAVRMMYYILTDDEYSALNSGNEEKLKQKLFKYWTDRDPTKGTPYNEAMAQYFKRVDHAFFNYQSVREKDGAKTERGKIYILYGLPDSVDNKFVKNKSREIWTYKKLKKTFTFEIGDKGVYELKEINAK